ncbi:hypothetical protein D9613_002134 [Agrocybe pediades]|uniref:Homeobox domain-containing protein n=1 Tax=Agrocybe pediades TaxID=84607 RepID=A0A8H4R7Y9_9AGAR|nr:hypothetical protein D9613_002134 [Agrocybe pediades]KAF9566155.1 hypothetical protein CPC08DRAFT_733763 [Agrocybe pediades]
MTSVQLDPLHFLACVISDTSAPIGHHSSSPEPSSSASSSLSSSPEASSSNAVPFLSQDIASLHVPFQPSKIRPIRSHRILKHTTSSNHPSSPVSSFVPFIRHKSGRQARKSAESVLKCKAQMKKRRKELLEKACKIKSLDNSPVNERQLLVLRMVYDEITMYPSESWMVLIAIIIHRAYKQVKNWFSNERQKNRTGESVSLETEEGDKIRLRSTAYSTCQDWSDAFFEEVTMIYNYRVQCNSRFRGAARRLDVKSNNER